MGMFWLNVLLVIGNGWFYLDRYMSGDTLWSLIAAAGVAAGLIGMGAGLLRIKLRGYDD